MLGAWSLELPAQTLLNPSFESGSCAPFNGFVTLTTVQQDCPNLSDWLVINAAISWGASPNPSNIVASDGVRFLNLTGFHGRPTAASSRSSPG